ncbi:hypothetical protein J6590_026650 [Homalodisca vitripennis]|nr:hypothetical protein J6590_026650 [Homalodisca vitripennis]
MPEDKNELKRFSILMQRLRNPFSRSIKLCDREPRLEVFGHQYRDVVVANVKARRTEEACDNIDTVHGHACLQSRIH